MDKTARILDSGEQLRFIGLARELLDKKIKEIGRQLTFHVTTFGCQMNARDSEKLIGILKDVGYVWEESEDADLVIYNTCTVRDNANQKVYGKLGYLHGFKKKNPLMKIGMCGCMMQEPSVVEKIQKSYPFVDMIFGTHNIYQLGELIYLMLGGEDEGHGVTVTKRGQVISVWDEASGIMEDLPTERKYPFKSGVNIMYGCDNFCSYCIVPYVRGRERSRDPKEIIREIERLCADGVSEIMLLGQNVNSYGHGADFDMSFPELLREVCRVEGIERVRFMTSHPKDLSDELISVMADEPKVCRHLHLPLQSGSSRLLAEMNRHYDKDKYLDLVDRIKDAIPDIALTTDIIVGYPTETEEDFLETMDVVSKVRYSAAFTFIYSQRTGTPAAKLPMVPEAVVHDRFDRLLKLVQDIGAEENGKLVGSKQVVLVEQLNEKEPGLVTGRLSNNLTVHLPGDASMIGQYVPVTITESGGFYLKGE